MEHIKIFWTFTLLCCFCFCLAACGKETAPETEAPNDSAAAETQGYTKYADYDPIKNEDKETSATNQSSGPESSVSDNTDEMESDAAMKMNVQIGEQFFTATLEDNAAARELVDMMKEAPVSIDMTDYSGFEKVGSLGRSLTTANRQTTTSAGDIVLYNGDNIVMFYGSNSWSYTRLGHIDDLTGWEEALGSGDITAVFSIKE